MVDLRKAKPGDVYVDGYGYKVRILCNDRNDGDGKYNVVALKESRNGEEVMTYTLEGKFVHSENTCHNSLLNKFDLVKQLIK